MAHVLVNVPGLSHDTRKTAQPSTAAVAIDSGELMCVALKTPLAQGCVRLSKTLKELECLVVFRYL